MNMIEPKTKTALPAPNYGRALLARLGTDSEIADLIRDRGFRSPPESTIRGWRTRNSVPSRWLLVLVKIAIDTGKIKSMDDLLDSDSPF